MSFRCLLDSIAKTHFRNPIKHLWWHIFCKDKQILAVNYFCKKALSQMFKATEPLRGDSLLFTTQSPGVPCTHLINFDMMKS